MRAAAGGPAKNDGARVEAASSSHDATRSHVTQSPVDPTQCVFQEQVWEWSGTPWAWVRKADTGCTIP
eukprot:9630374-Lingulodinium_polyedra.AAC.1